MSSARVSGGTLRQRVTVDGARVDQYAAVCRGCGSLAKKNAPSQRAARREAESAGWRATLVRVPMFGGGQTRVWRVECPSCLVLR